MKILLVTDTWTPNVNGVVRVLSRTVEQCETLGHKVRVISPHDGFSSLSMGKMAESPHPDHPPNRLAIGGRRRMRMLIRDFAPDAVHLATEGPLGWAARAVCRRHNMPFTSAYHTRFPEYFAEWAAMPLGVSYSYLRRFHRHSARVLVPSSSVGDALNARGFPHIVPWPHGVDTDAFHPRFRKTGPDSPIAGMPTPVFAYVGRVAIEKNVRAFLELDLPGSKLIVGDGPARKRLQQDFPQAHFAGTRLGDDLTAHFASSDVFVLPSLTETFGLVMLEALACGVPVAAYDAPGPRDVLTGTKAGCVDPDLKTACLACLSLDRADARELAESYSWEACAKQFLGYLQTLPAAQQAHVWSDKPEKPEPL